MLPSETTAATPGSHDICGCFPHCSPRIPNCAFQLRESLTNTATLSSSSFYGHFPHRACLTLSWAGVCRARNEGFVPSVIVRQLMGEPIDLSSTRHRAAYRLGKVRLHQGSQEVGRVRCPAWNIVVVSWTVSHPARNRLPHTAWARQHYSHAAISHLVLPSSDLLGEMPDARHTTCYLSQTMTAASGFSWRLRYFPHWLPLLSLLRSGPSS